jgi:pyruvate,orthophosphate dikinase
MMDTILNVGLNVESDVRYSKLIGERAVLDCWCRFMKMYGTVVSGIDADDFKSLEQVVCSEQKAPNYFGLDAHGYDALSDRFDNLLQDREVALHTNPVEQITECAMAVFRSWDNERARVYRNANGIPHDMGTAVVVQAMVFGNAKGVSGSGVMFSRCPSTGGDHVIGEFLPNSQGEDVVAGTSTPMSILEMGKTQEWAGVLGDLVDQAHKVEKLIGDMADVEFTVQEGQVYLLQCRAGKRTNRAAVRIALDMLKAGELKVGDLHRVLKRRQVAGALCKAVSDKCKIEPSATGLPAGGGVVAGVAVMQTNDALLDDPKMSCVLIRNETDPDDLGAMLKAKAFLTAKGGVTSHAAVVARAMNKVCVTAVAGMAMGMDMVTFSKGKVLVRGAAVVVDGDTGRVWVNDAALQVTPHLIDGGSEVEELAQAVAEMSAKLPADDVVTSLEIALNPEVEAVQAKKLAGKKMTQGLFVSDCDRELFDSMGLAQSVMVKKVEKVRELGKLEVLGTTCNATLGKLLTGDENLVLTEAYVQTVIGGQEVLQMLREKFPQMKVSVLGGRKIDILMDLAG